MVNNMQSKKELLHKRTIYLTAGIAFLVAFVTVFALVRCSRKEPIKVGFLGEFSAYLADWTIACRDGAVLRIEEFNAAGGVGGRPIELIMQEVDENDPFKAVDQLIQAGVVAILGPVSSTVALKVVPYANTKRLLMVSPSASTNVLTDQDDFLIRVTQTQVHHARTMASYLFEKLGWRKISGTFTTTNRAYSEEWFNALKERFEQLGGSVFRGELISENPDGPAVAKSLAKDSPDGVVVVGHALAVASICQELRKIGVDYRVATSGVVQTDDLIQQGGAAVEGILFSLTFLKDESTPGFQDFKTRYHKRFGKSPYLPDVYGYEAATVLTGALTNSQDWSPENLKQTIIKTRKFSSPISPGGIIINKFGDVERNIIMVTVNKGKFVRVE